MNEWFLYGHIGYKLFIDPSLDTWANVAEFVGVAFSLVSIIITLVIKKEVNDLRRNFSFDKRVTAHIKKLQLNIQNLNLYLNSYSQNIRSIVTELGKCQVELEDLSWKLEPNQKKQTKQLMKFILKIKKNNFSTNNKISHPLVDKIIKPFRRLVSTNVSDIWYVHDSVVEIINQLENIKLNRKNSL
jgi:hypothetical protein